MVATQRVNPHAVRTMFALEQYADIVSMGAGAALAPYISKKFCEMYEEGPFEMKPILPIEMSESTSPDYAYLQMRMDPYRVNLTVDWKNDSARLNAFIESSVLVFSSEDFQRVTLNSVRCRKFSKMTEEERLSWVMGYVSGHLERLFTENKRRDETVVLARRILDHKPKPESKMWIRNDLSLDFIEEEHARMDAEGIGR